MRTLIVYYSLSGTTAKVARELGGLLGAELAEIRCARYRSGILSYFRAAYDSVKGRLPVIDVPAAVDRPCDLMIVAAPIWAGHPATPIRAFLAGGHKLPGKIGLLLTRGGSSPDAAFAEMQARLPAPASAKLALRAKDIQDDAITEALRAFASEMAGEGVRRSLCSGHGGRLLPGGPR
jgi:flavodoxin